MERMDNRVPCEVMGLNRDLCNQLEFAMNYAVFEAMYCNKKPTLKFEGVNFLVWYDCKLVYFKNTETSAVKCMKINTLGPTLKGDCTLWLSLAYGLRQMIKANA